MQPVKFFSGHLFAKLNAGPQLRLLWRNPFYSSHQESMSSGACPS